MPLVLTVLCLFIIHLQKSSSNNNIFLDYSEHCKGWNKTSPILPRQIISLLEGGVETGSKYVTRQELSAYLQGSWGWYFACTKACSKLLRLVHAQTSGRPGSLVIKAMITVAKCIYCKLQILQSALREIVKLKDKVMCRYSNCYEMI